MKVEKKRKKINGRYNVQSMKPYEIVPEKLYRVGELLAIFEDCGHRATHSWLYDNLKRGAFEQGIFQQMTWSMFEYTNTKGHRRVRGKTLLFLLKHKKKLMELSKR